MAKGNEENMHKKPGTIRPCSDYVLLKVEQGEKVLESGLVIPGTVEHDMTKPRQGEVLAVGPGKWSSNGTERLPMSVKPGDVVIFRPVFSGMEKHKGINSPLQSGQVLLRNEDILGVVEEA